MTELQVPFVEKDEAKSLGARWNSASKRWYVPTGIDLAPFAKWLDPNVAELSNSNPTTAEAGQQSLAQFLQKVAQHINSRFARLEWISAEISELRINKGHMFLTLVEHDDSGNMIARTSARVWQAQVGKLMAKFREGTGSELEAGLKVLLLARCEFHSQYGLALFIDDIDPSFTLGDMAAKMLQIREALTKAKIIDNNKSLPKPRDFTKVAVISPSQAAGLGDFNSEAELLAKHGLCEFQYFSAQFQGANAPREIIAALDHALLVHKDSPFDAIVIIRGGGALSDLAWLNNEQLARAVCNAPVHIMAGIGHERDFTIIDEVAGERFDTPSKVSQRIFQKITGNATEALAAYQQIHSTADGVLQGFRDKITMLWQNLVQHGIYVCEQVDKQLKLQIAEILNQNPKQVLKRGYALVYNKSEQVISSKIAAEQETTLTLEFHDGRLDYELQR